MGLGAAWGGGNLYPIPPTNSDVKFPPTVSGRKLRSRERSDYLQVTQEVRSMHSFNTYFEHSPWAKSSARPWRFNGERKEHSCQCNLLKA